MITHEPFSGITPADLSEAPDLSNPDALFRKCYAYLVAVARRWLDYAAPHDRAVGADDLAQVAAMNAYRALAEFDPARGRFTTFLALHVKRAASNVRSAVVAQKRTRPVRATARRTRGTDDRLAVVPDPKTPPPFGTADFWELVNVPLTDLQRDVLAMRFVEGMEFHEIGERLGSSRTNAWQTCNAALKKLREQRDRLRAAGGVG
jgi:RNA polymerase sigma factor (sigma-70 family)